MTETTCTCPHISGLYHELTCTLTHVHTECLSGDNEEFEIITNPDQEGKTKPQDGKRTISITSDELLGDGRGNESVMEDDDLEFHDTAGDHEFEVLDGCVVIKSDPPQPDSQVEGKCALGGGMYISG